MPGQGRDTVSGNPSCHPSYQKQVRRGAGVSKECLARPGVTAERCALDSQDAGQISFLKPPDSDV